jgi:hypothetical protein
MRQVSKTTRKANEMVRKAAVMNRKIIDKKVHVRDVNIVIMCSRKCVYVRMRACMNRYIHTCMHVHVPVFGHNWFLFSFGQGFTSPCTHWHQLLLL